MNDPVSSSAAPRDTDKLDQLDQLRGRFPAYSIDRHPDRFGREPRYEAVARDPKARLRCVISPDPAEIAAVLTESAAESADELARLRELHPDWRISRVNGPDWRGFYATRGPIATRDEEVVLAADAVQLEAKLAARAGA